MIPRPDAKLLLDILLSARRAIAYLRGIERSRLEADPVLQDAVVRRLEIVGEAATRVSAVTRTALPDVPWRQIAGMRNRIVHEYFRIDLDVVWETVKQDLPPLIALLEPVIPPDDGGP